MPPEPTPPAPDPMDEACDALLEAYAQGLFPMGEPGGDIHWFDPDPRGVIPLAPGGLRVSRSLRQRVRSGCFEITSDEAFGRVIRACAAARPGRDGGETWIDDRIVTAYCALQARGHAHSVEAWTRDSDGSRALVGGLYGVHLGGLFAGESMFSRPELGGTDASKVCLVHLVVHLRARGFTLLDTQFRNDHLARLGCIEISRGDYLSRLEAAISIEPTWEGFNAEHAQAAPEVRASV